MTGEAAEGRQERLPAEDEGRTGEPAAESEKGASRSADPEDTEVPSKQIHRWKDDGGAVIFD